MPDGPTLRIDPCAPRPPRHETLMESTLDRTEPARRIPATTSRPTSWFSQRIDLWWDAQPNESRLSCGAGLEHSQGEFYHTARKTFSGSLGTGAASFKRWLGCAPQVIARVRPPQELRGALTVAYLLWNCEAEWAAARDSPHAPRPKRNGTFIWKALWNRTEPPRRMPPSDSEPTTWVFRKKTWFGESCAA